MAGYRYTRLNEATGEIRLLTIIPRSSSPQLRVLLKTTILTDASVPSYEALSYTWGSHNDLQYISVGESGLDRVPITQNLAEVLPFLQHETEVRTLWVDALCVNQEDLEERRSQVKRMPELYSKATRVVVWLGPEQNNSNSALDSITALGNKVDIDKFGNIYCLSDDPAEAHWADSTCALPFNRDLSRSISVLIDRPWFSRLWIWQEIRLASPASIVMCGAHIFYWVAVRKGLMCISRKGLQDTSTDNTFLLYRLCNYKTSIDLVGLIRQTAATKCSDPRDRVFALLSLLSEGGRNLAIEPDYTKSVQKVYMDTTMLLIQLHRSLRVLTTVELKDQMDEQAKGPSWVPDWSSHSGTEHWADFPASLVSEAVVRYYGAQLQVTGAYVDTIETIQSFQNRPGMCGIIEEIRRLAIYFGVDNEIQDRKLLQAFTLTLCTDNTLDRRPVYTYLQSRIEVTNTLANLLDQQVQASVNNLDPKDETLLKAMKFFCQGRSYFMTKAGHFGLAPKSARIGDIVAVLLGSPSATILRPLTKEEDRYLLVGPSYLHGFMDGEAFLGPLPNQVEIALCRDEDSEEMRWKYRNRESEEIGAEDPRMGVLSKPWIRKVHTKQKHWTWFINKDTGAEMVYGKDPRFNKELMQNYNINLQKFLLV